MISLVLDRMFDVPVKSAADMSTRLLYILIWTSRKNFELEIIDLAVILFDIWNHGNEIP